MLSRLVLTILILILFNSKTYAHVVFPHDSCYFDIVKYSENNNYICIFQTDSLNAGVDPYKRFKIWDIKKKKIIFYKTLDFDLEDFCLSNDNKNVLFYIKQNVEENDIILNKKIISENKLILFNLVTNKFDKTISLDKKIISISALPFQKIKKVIFNPKNNAEIALIYTNGKISIFNLKTNKFTNYNFLETNKIINNTLRSSKTMNTKLQDNLNNDTLDNLFFNDIEYSKDGKNLLITNGKNDFLIFDFKKNKILKIIQIIKKDPDNILTNFIYDKVNDIIILKDKNNILYFLSIKNNKVYKKISLDSYDINEFIYNSKHNILGVKTPPNSFFLNMKTLKKLDITNNDIKSILFSPDNNQILFTTEVKTMDKIEHAHDEINIFDLTQNKILQKIRGR